MDDPHQLPHMLCDGDMLSIYECAECGAVIRDPDTHIGWHTSRQWTNPMVVDAINNRHGCSLKGCGNEAHWQVPTTHGPYLAFLLCREHLQDVVAMVPAMTKQEARRG